MKNDKQFKTTETARFNKEIIQRLIEEDWKNVIHQISYLSA